MKQNHKKNKPLKSWTNLKQFGSGQQSVVRRCSRILNITSNGSGFAQAVVGTSSVNSATEWSSLTARYAEFRVLRIKVHYVDLVTTPSAVVFAGDRAGNLATPTTVAEVWARDAAKAFNSDTTTPNMPKYQMSAIDIEDQDFQPVNAPSNNYAIHMALEGFAASATIGRLYVEYMVEFRGAN